ncbi:MAG TPA: IniB N-terminal domain-containing protein [Pseudonocardia sp.]|jgi:hypothetical protein|nr:IniB N-terminal domain-containing protein [Pseudonocardia sp.]
MAQSLLDWILDLLRDVDAREEFRNDPDRYAAEHGFKAVTAADVHDALCVAADTGWRSPDSDDDDRHHVPPPRHHASHGHHGGGGHHEDPVKYLHQYVTNNFTTVEEHKTEIDNSVHQNVDTHGGDFNQVIDNDPVVASGDHSVATGGDIADSTVTPGNGAVVGDDNLATTGNDNNSAFGSGDATRANLNNVHTGAGSGMAFSGDSAGRNDDTDTNTNVHSSGSGATSVDAAGPHGQASQFADQHEHDDSTRSNYTDSSEQSQHNAYDSNNDASYEDSHNYHHV